MSSAWGKYSVSSHTNNGKDDEIVSPLLFHRKMIKVANLSSQFTIEIQMNFLSMESFIAKDFSVPNRMSLKLFVI
jgi:hypothetical protein